MAATTSTPSLGIEESSQMMTWEAFERLPDGDGMHREIIEGELQALPPAKFGHSQIATHCYEILRELKEKGIGRVYMEAGCKLSEDPATWLQPDVSFIGAARKLPAADDYLAGAPDLAVEIVSPSEAAVTLQAKVELLLAAGGRAVWVVYPSTQTIVVHLPGGTSFTRTIGDTLDAPYLLEGWQFPVAKLFGE